MRPTCVALLCTGFLLCHSATDAGTSARGPATHTEAARSVRGRGWASPAQEGAAGRGLAWAWGVPHAALGALRRAPRTSPQQRRGARVGRAAAGVARMIEAKASTAGTEAVFQDFDRNKDGAIDADELREALPAVDARTVESLLREADEDGDGSISPRELTAPVAEPTRVHRLESTIQAQIESFLRIPPKTTRLGSADLRAITSPSGLARQEFREQQRGLCKIRRYNPDMLRPTDIQGWFLATQRLAQVVAAVSALALALLRTAPAQTGSVEDARKVKADAKKVRETLTRMGATFVKVGQVLANRPDMIRADYMDELTKLQDKVPCFPNEEAFALMRSGFGRDPHEIFDDISPQPLAAASLGQVYKARLRRTGEEVAIKVQRPGVAEVIKRDIYLMRLLAKNFNEEAVRRIGVDAVTLLDEFAENLLEELDYTQEASNIEAFLANFDGDPMVKIPAVYPDLCSEKVLVLEWIDGVRCTDTARILAMDVPVDAFIRKGVDAQTRQLLEFGLFHGDPHPGNIFALRDGRIAYVDFGSVAELSQTDKECLVDCVVYAMDGDFMGITQSMQDMGFIMPGTDRGPIAEALEQMWTDAVGRDLQDLNLRQLTKEFSKLVYAYPIRVPERFALVIRTLLTQEGICLTLEPNFKLLEVAYPAIAARLLRDDTYSDRLPQVLMKPARLSSKPVFDFARLFALLSIAASVAGSGNVLRGLGGLAGTMYDGARLLARKPALAVDLGRGMLRTVRTKIYEAVAWVFAGVRRAVGGRRRR